MTGTQGADILKAILSLIIVVVIFIVGVTIVIRFPQTECWNNALSELDKVSSSTTGGFDKCLGRVDFTIYFGVTSCVQRVEFTDYQGCVRACNEVGGEGTENLEREKCLESCWEKCRGGGCMLAIPRLVSSYRIDKPDEWLSRFREGYNKMNAYSTGGYSFRGDTLYTQEDLGEWCLNFKKTDSDEYLITREKSTKEKCRVSRCG